MKYFIASLLIHIFAVLSISSSIAGNSQQNYEVAFFSPEKTQNSVSKSRAGGFRKVNPSVPVVAESAQSPNTEAVAGAAQDGNSGTISLNGEIGPTQSIFSYLVNQIYNHRIYPHESIRLKQQGQVTVKFFIDENGELTDIHVANPCSHKLLNQAAIKTLSRIKINKDLPEVQKLFNRNYSFTFDFEITKSTNS